MKSTWYTDMISLIIMVIMGGIALQITHAPDWAGVLLVISLWGSAAFR